MSAFFYLGTTSVQPKADLKQHNDSNTGAKITRSKSKIGITAITKTQSSNAIIIVFSLEQCLVLWCLVCPKSKRIV